MTSEQVVEAYNNIDNNSDKIAIVNLLKRPHIVNLINQKLENDVFEGNSRLSSHDVNILANLFVNSGQPVSEIEKFILDGKSIDRKNVNILKRTTNEAIARDLFYFTPTIGNNPTGPGEFLLAFHFSNVKKTTVKGDIKINGHKYELKSSSNRSSGGGKLNSSDPRIYGTPSSVMRTISKFVGVPTSSNILNPNRSNMLKLYDKLGSSEKIGAVGREMLMGLYPKIQPEIFDRLLVKYMDAVLKKKYNEFEEAFRVFQVRYYLDNHDEKLLFINRDSGNILSINSRSSDKDILKLNFKNSLSMKSKTNNVYQFSIN